MTFEQAHQRLQEIHTLLSSEKELTLDQIQALQEEAKLCYEKCNELLLQTKNSSQEKC